ncbi:MAG: hypothetical protein PHX68_00030 [Alphaproteobacteria bacterium]|nr:hypothetical protein [Alphaproteobacteria bacterium]
MEIEDKWILKSDAVDWKKLESQAEKTKKLEQGYLKDNIRNALHVDGGNLVCAGIDIALDSSVSRALKDFIDGQGLTQGEARYRKTSHAKGDTYVMTIKGKGTLGRYEAEFPISAEVAQHLQSPEICSGKVEKTRYMVPDNGGYLEIDRYHAPRFSFASIEREFSDEAETAAYRLPDDWLKAGAVKATERSEFKNKNLAIHPAIAENAAQQILLHTSVATKHAPAAVKRDNGR